MESPISCLWGRFRLEICMRLPSRVRTFAWAHGGLSEPGAKRQRPAARRSHRGQTYQAKGETTRAARVNRPPVLGYPWPRAILAACARA